MPIPSAISDLSVTPASNSPPGGESPTTADDYLRTYAAFLRQSLSSGADIASAATITPPSTASSFNVTGATTTTAISSSNSWDGRQVLFTATGAWPLTHSSNLILPGAANLTLSAGDSIVFRQETTGVWRCVGLNRVITPALIGAVSPQAVQNQTYTYFTTGGTGTAYTLTPSPAISAYTAGQSFFVVFSAASGAAPTLQISGVASPPNLVKQNPDGTYTNISAGDFPLNHRSRVTLISATQAWVEELPPPLPRGAIDGFTLSTAGSSATMSVSAGQATDSANAVMVSGAASSKTTAAWAVGSGNGGLDTGTIANSTWYYFYVIRRPDTGVVDYIFSTSSSSPTLPTNYTQYRYIGAGLTNGSGQWVKFRQDGDEFLWDTPVLDFSGAGSTSAGLITVSAPRGRRMRVLTNVFITSASQSVYLSDPSTADLAPSGTASPLLTSIADGVAGVVAGTQAISWTDTLGRIRYRNSSTTTWRLATLGWVDSRGRNA